MEIYFSKWEDHLKSQITLLILLVIYCIPCLGQERIDWKVNLNNKITFFDRQIKAWFLWMSIIKY